jgi:hypothetical protein
VRFSFEFCAESNHLAVLGKKLSFARHTHTLFSLFEESRTPLCWCSVSNALAKSDEMQLHGSWLHTEFNNKPQTIDGTPTLKS